MEYKERLLQFIGSLRLSTLKLQVQLDKRTLMKIELSDTGEEGLLPDKELHRLSHVVRAVVEKALSLPGASRKLQLIVTVGFAGKTEDAVLAEEARIAFTNLGDVWFHNMRRDYVTELSYLLYVVSERWKT